jgi:2',3'-cyclic-nucleotide 2'-phosphodiesterase
VRFNTPAEWGPVPSGAVRLAFLGDVVGGAGRAAVLRVIPELRRAGVCFVVVNGENASGGNGLAAKEARELLAGGADVLTLGNHTWKHKDVVPLLESEPRILRPANFAPGAPGRGWGVFPLPDGSPFLVASVLGRVYMDPTDCPFRALDAILREAGAQVGRPGERFLSLVDVHAEATAEKKALFFHLDGRVTAAFGTHTHVQTSDATVSSLGTARLTDAGLCGASDSIIGFQPEAVLQRFRTLRPAPYRPSDAVPCAEGAVFDALPVDGRCLAVSAIRMA